MRLGDGFIHRKTLYEICHKQAVKNFVDMKKS